jgi:regulator of cell morphogenesis and NO signaling
MNNKNGSKASLIELVEYIEQQHCQLKEQFQKLQTLLEQMTEQDKNKHSSILVSLQEFYVTFKDALENHFGKEEEILIPYLRQMDAYDKNIGPKPEFHHSSIKNPISQLEYDHDHTENVMFDKLHAVTQNFQLPPNSSEAFKDFYEGLKEIENKIRKHINVEQNMLFPLAIGLELQLRHKRT